jgi:hypothetical protein
MEDTVLGMLATYNVGWPCSDCRSGTVAPARRGMLRSVLDAFMQPPRLGRGNAALQSPYRDTQQVVGGGPRLSLVSSGRVGKETNHVKYQLSSVTRLAATALLVGLAVVACGRPNDAGGNQTANSTPVAQQSQADQGAATLAPTPVDAATSVPATSDTTTDSAAAAAPSAAAGTADPLDNQLSNLQNLLNGVNGSLSGSDTSGGE